MTYKSCDEEYHKAADQRPKKYNSTMLRIAIYIAVASLVCPDAIAGEVCSKYAPDYKSCYECYLREEEEREKQQEKLESPMLWIGIYIAAASLFCSVAMAGDLIHGIRQKKLWFPCKFFTVNAASLTVLAVSTKLLVDLTTPMEGIIDSEAKLISTVFVITIMGNFLTSFASMDSNAILTNTVALGILVITITVNECIQIVTGAIGTDFVGVLVAIVLVCMFFLFVTLIFSVLTVPTTKRYLELKYGELHKTISNGGKLEETGKLTNQKLKEVVEKYWVMAESSNSQFVMARSVTSATCGVICLLTALPLLFACAWGQVGLAQALKMSNRFGWSYLSFFYSSSYQWSIPLIFIIQLIGVLVGSIAPACRWFTAIDFNCRNLFTDNRHREFKLVETYWIQRWVEWKERPLPSCVRHLKCKKVIQHVRICILNLCIGIQIGIVVASKLVQLISVIIAFPLFSCFYYCKRLKDKLKFHDSSVSTDHGSAEQEISSPELDLNDYVLLLEGEAKLPNRILKNMCLQMNKEIRKGQNQQPKKQRKNLEELLLKSRSNFKGVADFDSSQVSNCWTLPVVTLTAIAVALPNIEIKRAKRLISSVSKGLSYADLVEKSFSSKGDDVLNMKRAADVAWTSIELDRKWLGKGLRKLPLEGKLPLVKETLQTLLDRAAEAAIEFQKTVTGGPKVLAANSMHRISQTILKEYEGNKDVHTDGSLFEQLSIMIADILGACLSNLPRVIIRKCYCSAIEEREKSVKHAARLLGETEEILKILGHHQLPCLSGDRAAYIDEWRAVMMQKETSSILSSAENETAVSGSSELHIDVDE